MSKTGTKPPTRYRTKKPCGYLPAGMTVEVVTLSLPGGLGGDNRDHGAGGDGQHLLVKYPNGVVHGQVRTAGELARIGINLEDLEEIT